MRPSDETGHFTNMVNLRSITNVAWYCLALALIVSVSFAQGKGSRKRLHDDTISIRTEQPDPIDVCHDSINHIETLLHRFPQLANTDALIEALICPYGDLDNFDRASLEYRPDLDRIYAVVKLLVGNGADPEDRGYNYRGIKPLPPPQKEYKQTVYTSLEYAPDSAIADLLIEHGAKVNGACHGNLLNGSGFTPLGTVLFSRRVVDIGLVRVLLGHGANPNPKTQTDNNETLLYHVVQEAEPVEGVLGTNFSFSDSAVEIDTQLVSCLVKAGANVNENRPESVLLPAVRNRAVEVLKMLLDAGSEVNWRDKNGDPVLFHALRLLHSDEAVELEHANDVKQSPDDEFNIGWLKAAKFDVNRDHQIIEMLQAHGAVER